MISLNKLSTVTMFVGLPGSGKTTLAAAIIKKALKSKKYRAFSNVPIYGAFEYSWQKDFGKADLSQSIIILDEAGLDVDNRSWEKNFDKDKVSMLKLLRHYSSKLIVFSQTWNDCDIKIRSMVGKLFIVRPSLLPFTTVAIPIWRKIDVDEEDHDFKELYYKDSIIFRLFSCSRCFRPAYYNMFNSWEAPSLPERPFKIYKKEV